MKTCVIRKHTQGAPLYWRRSARAWVEQAQATRFANREAAEREADRIGRALVASIEPAGVRRQTTRAANDATAYSR